MTNKEIKIFDAANYILANPFDVHLVEAKAKEILKEITVPIVAQETESQDDNWREVESILYDSEDLGFPTEKLKSTFLIQICKQ